MVADENSEFVGEGATGDTGAEDLGLEAIGAEGQPLVVDHFFKQNLLVGVSGLELGLEVGEEVLEIFGVFAGDEEGGAVEAVGEPVLGRLLPAGCGARSGGFLGVFAVGFGLSCGGHLEGPFELDFPEFRLERF